MRILHVRFLKSRNHESCLFLQRGHEIPAIDNFQNLGPLVVIPNTPNYPHLHLPSRVCIFKPFGKWTKILLYQTQIAIVRPYDIFAEPAL